MKAGMARTMLQRPPHLHVSAAASITALARPAPCYPPRRRRCASHRVTTPRHRPDWQTPHYGPGRGRRCCLWLHPTPARCHSLHQRRYASHRATTPPPRVEGYARDRYRSSRPSRSPRREWSYQGSPRPGASHLGTRPPRGPLRCAHDRCRSVSRWWLARPAPSGHCSLRRGTCP